MCRCTVSYTVRELYSTLRREYPEKILHILVALVFYSSFFFFQAEDGIRDLTVTGVQTCALPISARVAHFFTEIDDAVPAVHRVNDRLQTQHDRDGERPAGWQGHGDGGLGGSLMRRPAHEKRRGDKDHECAGLEPSGQELRAAPPANSAPLQNAKPGNDGDGNDFQLLRPGERSEERRVGKECRSRWSPDH